MYDIHVFHSGAIARDVIVAVSTFIGDKSMATMMSMVAMISIPLTLITFLGTKSPKAITGWCLTTLLVPTMLLHTTADVEIIDSSNPMKVYSATNVPLIVAFPAHLATSYMYGATRAFENIFHVNDDEAYTKTGMLFGSTLINHNINASIRDSTLQRHWTRYLHNCLRQDITVNHKYTYADVLASSDILTFLSTHSPSPLRGIIMDDSLPDFGGFETCQEALPKITAMFDKQVPLQFKAVANYLGNDRGENIRRQGIIESAMSDTQQSLMSISQTSRELIRQGMVINATRRGVVDGASEAGATGAAVNLAAAQTELQSVNTMIAVGTWAQKKIPLIHTVLILVIIAVSPLVLAAAMMPNLTISVLMNSMKGYLYVATWPIMFAIINFIFTSLTKATLPNFVGTGGLSFDNYSDITDVNNELAATAGWFMMFVPYAAKMAVTGASGFMQNAAMQFAGMVNGITGGVAREVSTGNMTLGSSHDNEHSYNNINANKHHSDFTDIGGSGKLQYSDGSSRTDFNAGNHAYDGTNPISKLGTSINMGQSIRDNLTHQQTQADTALSSATTSLSSAQSDLASELISNTKSSMESQQAGTGTSSTSQSSIASDYSAVDSLTKSYAKNNGMSYDEAYNNLTSNALNGSVGVGLDFLGNGAKANASGEMSESNRDGQTYSHGESGSENASTQQQFNQRLADLQQHVQSESTGDNSSQTDSSTRNLSNTFSKVDTLQQAKTEAQTHSEAISNALSHTQESSAGYSENLSQPFTYFIDKGEKNNHNSEGLSAGQIITGTSDAAINLRDGYAEQFVKARAQSMISTNEMAIKNQGEHNAANLQQQGHDTLQSYRNNGEHVQNHFDGTQYNEQKTRAQQGQDNIQSIVEERGEHTQSHAAQGVDRPINNEADQIATKRLLDEFNSLFDKK